MRRCYIVSCKGTSCTGHCKTKRTLHTCGVPRLKVRARGDAFGSANSTTADAKDVEKPDSLSRGDDAAVADDAQMVGSVVDDAIVLYSSEETEFDYDDDDDVAEGGGDAEVQPPAERSEEIPDDPGEGTPRRAPPTRGYASDPGGRVRGLQRAQLRGRGVAREAS